MRESQPSVRIADAVATLRAGRLVAFPTETVYGLGADAASVAAMELLYAVKGRPLQHPVIVHLAGATQLDSFASRVPSWARDLAATLWPGPLTLIVDRKPGAVCDQVTGGRDTVGLRVPDHPLALELLDAFGGGIAAPSANRFGKVSPTTAEHVRADLGVDVDVVLDGGACKVGVESTIVDATGERPVIVRVGAIDVSLIAAICGLDSARSVAHQANGEVAAPGTLVAHYSPTARVEITTVTHVTSRADALVSGGAHVAVLASSAGAAAQNALAGLPTEVVVLRQPSTVEEYAHVLYARLRDADALGIEVLLVVPPSPEGIGAAVIDRLRRASARPLM